MNPLYNTGCHKSVHDLLEERKNGNLYPDGNFNNGFFKRKS